ncbi:MAG: tRNA-dihydrouridine synthase family protein [Deltaproteobacteria bacterium]|nr:tRNA-dihydrouridine synthase family protein [Deltaproteobacteria bacterium]
MTNSCKDSDKSPWLVLAPIRGVTDAAFRSAHAAIFGGFDEALAPFVVPERAHPVRARDLAEVSPGRNRALPTVPQILADDAELFLQTASLLAESGCKVVNWNLGCPHPMVTRRKRGAGLLPHPDRIEAFLSQVVPAVGLEVSVKLRLGMNDPSEILQVIPVLNRFALREVIIHPRTAAQMYKGKVDLDAFERVAPLCSHPVVYNGDLCDASGFQVLSRRFPGISRWMIGRGALSDPSLALAIRGQTLEPADRLQRYRRLHDSMLAHYTEVLQGQAHVIDKMAGLWSYWVDAIPGKRKLIRRLLKIRELDRFKAGVDQILGD